MRIARAAYKGANRYGIIEKDRIQFLAAPPFDAIRRTQEFAALADVKLLPPTEPVNFWGVGFNYPSHLHQAQETSGQSLPTMPRPWQKGVGSMIGPDEAVLIPPEAAAVHYEGELVIVISKRARRLTAKETPNYILGYTIGNDVSEKGSWERDGTMWRAKNTDTFGPVGPWIETNIDPGSQILTVRLNGKVMDTTNTAQMIHKPYDLVAYMSQFTTLFPGDLILTGASGETVAMKPGDVCEVEISGIGVLRNPIEAEPMRRT